MKTTLVLGASLKEERYSNRAIRQLLVNNYDVKAIGLRKGNVNGVAISTEMLPFEAIDTVTLYLNPKRQIPYYNYIIALRPNRVIFNPGTENPEFYALLKAQNISYEVACTLVLLSTKQY